MNLLYNILLLIPFFALGQVQIDYKVKAKNKLPKSFYKSLEDATKEVRDANIKQNENPTPVFYELYVLDQNTSVQKFIDPVRNEQDNSGVTITISPFGRGNTLRTPKEPSSILQNHPYLGQNVYSKSDLVDLEWTKTKKDSLILGYKVMLYTAKKDAQHALIEYKTWVTQKLRPGLGVYNLKNKEGFVLAAEIKQNYKEEKGVYMLTKAYPTQIKKLKNSKNKRLLKLFKDFERFEVYSEEQIDKKYDEKNRLANEMRNPSSLKDQE